MQHSSLCRSISSSQWHSLSLYLSLRHTYATKAGSYAADRTNSTANKSSRRDDKAGVANATVPSYSQDNNINRVRIRTYNIPAKAHSTKNKGPRQRTGKYDFQAQGVRGNDNGKIKGGTANEKRTDATDATAVRRVLQNGMGDGGVKARRGREEHDGYRLLRRRSGAGDIRSQMKAELDSSRRKGLERPSGGSQRKKSGSLLDEVFPSNDSQSQTGSINENELAEMPRLGLEHLMKDEEYKAPTKAQSEEEKLRQFYKVERENLGKEKGILLVRGLGPSLEEEDFRRLSPKGKHIEGWEHELGNILKGMYWNILTYRDRKATNMGN